MTNTIESFNNQQQRVSNYENVEGDALRYRPRPPSYPYPRPPSYPRPPNSSSKFKISYFFVWTLFGLCLILSK
jgi:hypothetical protein